MSCCGIQIELERAVFVRILCGVVPEIPAPGSHAAVRRPSEGTGPARCDETQSGLIEVEVMPDHVHLLLDCDP